MSLNCVITDDEPIALEILEDYINMVPGLQLVAKCESAIETLSALRQNDVDVLFIDIKMPEISGLELTKSLKNPPMVVFTTAYPNYAYDGFELDITDYLLKPISIERFLKTVDKLYSRKSVSTSKDTASDNNTHSDKRFFFIKSDSEIVRLEFNDILFIEALENYVRIHCTQKQYISNTTMKNMETLLSPHGFLRIHKSFIVNISKVNAVQGNAFIINNRTITVGKSYRKVVNEVLKRHFLQ